MRKEIKSNSQNDYVNKVFSDEAKVYLNRYSGSSTIAHSFNIRRMRVYEMLNKYKVGKILDIGCGPGVMTKYLTDKGFEFFGVDVSKEMIKQCKINYKDISSANFSVGKIEHLEFPNSFFNIVICMGVVEYIDSDSAAIKEMTRVVKPDETLVISLPNKYSPYRIWNRYIYSNITKYIKKIISNKGEQSLIHREYSEKNYCSLLKIHNLEIVDIVYYNFKVLPYPLDKLLPDLSVFISKKLEFLCRSKLRWIGTGLIVMVRKK